MYWEACGFLAGRGCHNVCDCEVMGFVQKDSDGLAEKDRLVREVSSNHFYIQSDLFPASCLT